jgi:hypothetical protein
MKHNYIPVYWIIIQNIWGHWNIEHFGSITSEKCDFVFKQG